MVILVMVTVVAVGVVMVRRRARKMTLAGLTSAKPQFMTTPPTRRLTRRGDDRP